MSEKRRKTSTAQTMTAAPEKPGSPFFLWAGIVLTASGTLFFNLYHDTRLLNLLVAIPAGILPPVNSVILGHAVKAVGDWWVKAGVFAVTICFMAVSATGSAMVLAPAYHLWGGYVLMLALDAGDLFLLYALIGHYEKVRAYKQWTLGRPFIAMPDVVPSAAAVLAPTGTGATAVPEPVPGATVLVPGTAAVPVPVGAEPAPVSSSGGKPGRPPVNKSPDAKTADAALRRKLADEMASRQRPAVEGVHQREVRAAKILTEFREKTGTEMNLGDFAKAVGVSKATAGDIRRTITAGPEGEQSEDRQEGTA